MLDKMEESIAHPDVHMEVHSDVVCEEVPKAGQNLPSSEQSSPPKRKLISLQYNLSDSEDEESREARKARVVSLIRKM